MSLQTQSTTTHSPSPLERCTLDILEQIVLSAAEEQFLGPPPGLWSLLATSKKINLALSPQRNNALYASIFALKFDTAAAARRLNERWLTSRCLASELRLRFEALRRIRRLTIDGYTLSHDLWTIFIILLEHDHKNTRQLTEWAMAQTFVLKVADRWLSGHYGGEFSENTGGLVCRIIWELVREDDLTEPVRRELQALLYVSVLGGYQLSSFYASEEFFTFDLHEFPDLEERIRGHPPASMVVPYYGHTITLAAPPLASACMSVFVLAAQPRELRYTPGCIGEYIRGRTFSERMDDEWHRLVKCHSLTPVQNGLGGRLFTPSALVGLWKGTILIPNLVAFRAFSHSNQPESAFNVPMGLHPTEMELREHHCLGDEVYILAGEGPDGIADDPLNAWIPRGTTFEEHNGTLEVYDPTEDQSTVYETYRIDAEHPYVSGYIPEVRWVPGDEADPGEPEQLEGEIVNEQDVPDETQGLVDNPSYVDEGQWEDTAEHRDSGITDILVTGTMKTSDQEHLLMGRVRSWDGLIVLRRLPITPNENPELSWVFRGYVHGERHIIGRWKQTSTPFGEIGWEGGFMFRKDS